MYSIVYNLIRFPVIQGIIKNIFICKLLLLKFCLDINPFTATDESLYVRSMSYTRQNRYISFMTSAYNSTTQIEHSNKTSSGFTKINTVKSYLIRFYHISIYGKLNQGLHAYVCEL